MSLVNEIKMCMGFGQSALKVALEAPNTESIQVARVSIIQLVFTDGRYQFSPASGQEKNLLFCFAFYLFIII